MKTKIKQSNQPICPYCSAILHNAGDYGLEDDAESVISLVTCGNCEKDYTVIMSVSVIYTSPVFYW